MQKYWPTAQRARTESRTPGPKTHPLCVQIQQPFACDRLRERRNSQSATGPPVRPTAMQATHGVGDPRGHELSACRLQLPAGLGRRAGGGITATGFFFFWKPPKHPSAAPPSSRDSDASWGPTWCRETGRLLCGPRPMTNASSCPGSHPHQERARLGLEASRRGLAVKRL